MAGELSFRGALPERPSRPDAGPLLALLLVVLAGVAISRPLWQGGPSAGTLVEVRGEVPHPGHYLVDPPTVERALGAAGLVDVPSDARPVPEGHQVRWEAGEALIRDPTDPLLVGLPIDIDTAEAHAFEAIPGIGSRTASRIVSDRQIRGPFRSVDDLARVDGISEATVERIRPFVVARGPSTIDVNRASVERLALLDGIGPVLAARIAARRERVGPFARIDELSEVRGIGPALVERLRDEASVGPPASP